MGWINEGWKSYDGPIFHGGHEDYRETTCQTCGGPVVEKGELVLGEFIVSERFPGKIVASTCPGVIARKVWSFENNCWGWEVREVGPDNAYHVTGFVTGDTIPTCPRCGWEMVESRSRKGELKCSQPRQRIERFNGCPTCSRS